MACIENCKFLHLQEIYRIFLVIIVPSIKPRKMDSMQFKDGFFAPIDVINARTASLITGLEFVGTMIVVIE